MAVNALIDTGADFDLFADATLVYLAKHEAPSTIFAIDHSDFETYQI